MSKCNHEVLNEHCASCNELQVEWYKKLINFNEIEDVKVHQDKVERTDNLKVWHNHYFAIRHTPEKMQAVAQYYRDATVLLTDPNYKFESPTHKQIWKLYTDGLSKREISNWLFKNERYQFYSSTSVQRILHQIKKYLCKLL